jgi:hypothetical protein
MEEPRKARVRLVLTERQKEQIRKATGRKVNRLELRLEALPEPTAPAEGEGGHEEGDG